MRVRYEGYDGFWLRDLLETVIFVRLNGWTGYSFRVPKPVTFEEFLLIMSRKDCAAYNVDNPVSFRRAFWDKSISELRLLLKKSF